MLDPWQEPPRGGHPGPSLLSLAGADQLTEMLEGRVPQPPISRLTGMRLREIGHGSAVFELPLSDWLRSPPGAISIGPLVMPADAAAACAIQTLLPARTPFSTSELSLRLLAPARPGDRLQVRGSVIKARTTIALAEASLIDEADNLIAHGSSLCLMQPQLAGAPEPHTQPQAGLDPSDQRPRGTEAPSDSPDPWQRPAIGEVVDPAIWGELGGLEILEAQLGGELPLPPIHYLTGLTLAAVSPGKSTFTLPASEWLSAPPPGRIQGGGVALLAEAALSGAIQTGVPAATALAPIDLKINYLRPLAADGGVATAHGHVIHAGRRICVADSEVLDAQGRRIAVATGSAMLLPGRPASLGAIGQ